MPFALTNASLITCGHGPGKVTAVGTAKLTVQGMPVLVMADVNGKAVGGCVTVTDPNTGMVQCALATVTAGASAKLQAGGQGVLLDTPFVGTTNGVTPPVPPPTKLTATANQAKLSAAG